ncbi:MAG: hypothetical protein ACJ77E_21305 [Gaiellaceae bacterium]
MIDMRVLVFAAVVTVAAAGAASAAADGLPVLGVDVGTQGVTVPASASRYVTIDQGGSTLVERIARNGGKVLGLMTLNGTFTIPAVAYDSSAGGLSADGRTLVLIQPRRSFPRRETTFALLDARILRVRRTFTLHGDFSFDAVSPGGRTMFLINYTSPDPTRYAVRAYDLRASRLRPAPITDPAEHSDKMRGSPITRLASADGRWAYTLYDGGGAAPFVHALDTATARAHCIDLDFLSGRGNVWQLRLRAGGDGGLTVVSSGGPVARVDLATFAAAPPPAPDERDLRPWLVLGAALAASALAVLAGRAVRRRPATA